MSAESAPTSMTVHHLSDSRSQRILWLLEELGLPYSVERYERLPTRQAPASMKAIHPLGKSPVLTDGNITVAESGAIVQYLIDKYGKGRAKPTTGSEVDNLYYLHYCEGTLMPLRVQGYTYTLLPSRFPALFRPLARFFFGKAKEGLVDPQLTENIAMISDHLASHGGQFATPDNPESGMLTAADYMMSFPLEALTTWEPKNRTPAIMAFLDKIHARPGYIKALAKGGNYAYGKPKATL